MNLFKSLFTFTNTTHIHKSIIALSFLSTLVLILVKYFMIGLIDLFGPESESFFNLLKTPAEKGLTFSVIVFVVSYLLSILMNLDPSD